MCAFVEQPSKRSSSEAHKSDLRCAKGVGVSFWDLKVCKRSLRDFLGVFLVLKVHYFEVVMFSYALF
jgi:hypothetical protein